MVSIKDRVISQFDKRAILKIIWGFMCLYLIVIVERWLGKMERERCGNKPRPDSNLVHCSSWSPCVIYLLMFSLFISTDTGCLGQSAWSGTEVTFSLTCNWTSCWSCGGGPKSVPIACCNAYIKTSKADPPIPSHYYILLYSFSVELCGRGIGTASLNPHHKHNTKAV